MLYSLLDANLIRGEIVRKLFDMGELRTDYILDAGKVEWDFSNTDSINSMFREHKKVQSRVQEAFEEAKLEADL